MLFLIKAACVKNIAIFASGTGTNAQKVVEHFSGHPHIQVALIVSNRSEAKVLHMAREKRVDYYVTHRDEFYQTEIVLHLLQRYAIDFVVLAGFLWLIPKYLLDAFPNRMVNLHPALLPRFGGKGMYGMRVHKAVKKAGEQESGITIHYVNENYDEGAVVLQKRVTVDPQDQPADIAAKVQALEHRYLAPTVEQLVLNLNK